MEVREYVAGTGRNPFSEWLAGLKDSKSRNGIVARLLRLADGLRGDWKSIGAGLFELPVHVGPGFRIYCGQDGPRLIIVLAGGDKHSQTRDVERAHEYWKDYKAHR
ncbi:MAG TPA: type II toxin-antitoxin system RelE/ParE family toxin [Rudaea sp.]|jgi:putative addiction module killer protein|nr:type II toxin-antitoxin system RelE/ParE family toxin [Rudaea sp.]